MMQVIMSTIAQERGTVDDIGFVDTTTLTQEVIKSPRYPVVDFTIPDMRIPHNLVPPLSNAMPDPIQSIPNLQLDNSS